MKLTVCVGSACHLKGAPHVMEQLQELIAQKDPSGQIELAASFCTGNCQKGVCVTLDGEIFSVTPDTTASFFDTEVLSRL